MMIKLIERLGEKTVDYYIQAVGFIAFVFRSMAYALDSDSYTQDSRKYLIQQLYLGTVKILPSFVFLALFLGSVFIVLAMMFAINFNLSEQIGRILVIVTVDEFAPLFSTFYILLHYGLSVHTETIKRKGEVDDPYSAIYVPKLFGALITYPSMALLFATIAVTGGYIVSHLYLGLDLATYKNMIINAITVEDLVILFGKSALLGYIVTILPLYYVDKAGANRVDAAGHMIRIVTVSFRAILVVEILLLFVVY
jgi:phospholipid/cholesterol/gamma-HCH transport system permease protein